jgi:hypothetical protein
MTRPRRLQLPHATGRAGMPNTAMACAFVRAILRLAAKQNSHARQVVLPTGPALVGEILVVLTNLQMTGAAGRKVRQ